MLCFAVFKCLGSAKLNPYRTGLPKTILKTLLKDNKESSMRKYYIETQKNIQQMIKYAADLIGHIKSSFSNRVLRSFEVARCIRQKKNLQARPAAH